MSNNVSVPVAQWTTWKADEKFIHDYDKFAAPLIYSDAHCG